MWVITPSKLIFKTYVRDFVEEKIVLYNTDMNVFGETRPFWLNSQDAVLFENVVQKISDGNCIAFVGAGLSSHAGYPLANDLIEHLRVETDISAAELDKHIDFASKAQILKDRLEDRFYQVLYRRFDDRSFDIQPTVPLFRHLVQIPFKSFITTNYDSCLENAAIDENIPFEEIQIYKQIHNKRLEHRNLYHIHGKIDPFDIQATSGSLVLTSDDYKSAYSEKSSLPLFLQQVFDAYNILFLGFDLEENTLKDLLKLASERFRFRQDGEPPSRIAILPISEQRIDEKFATEREIRIAREEMDDQNNEYIRDYDLVVLRYKASHTYYQIKEIIQQIHRILPAVTPNPSPDKSGETEF